MKGVIYTRVSSDEQIKGTSLDNQEELCRTYCEQKGISVVAVYREEGESAKDLSLKNRSQFLAALEFCKVQKDIAAFVVFKVDRFARSTDDHFAVRRVLRGCGTALCSVTEPIGDRPAEKFIETVLAGAAEYDNAIRKERCTGGMRARIKQGIWPFRAPIGYTCAHHRMRGEKKTVADEPDPVLFPLIQRALRVYATGEIVSQAALTRQLNVWGFAAVYGKPAFNQLVHSMLTKHLPFYAGKLVDPWTKKEVPGLHFPMISEGELASIRARLRGLSRGVPAKRTPFNRDFPLRRVLRCTSCGRFLTGANAVGNGGKYPYYYCVNKSCPLRSKGFRGDQLLPLFLTYLGRLSELSGEWARIERRARLILAERGDRTPTEREVQATRLRTLCERRARICEMREDGTYDAIATQQRLAVVDQEIAAIEAAGRDPRDLGNVDPNELTASIHWLLPRAALWWEKILLPMRPRFERVLFPEGIRYEKQSGFRTTKPGPVYTLFSTKSGRKSIKVELRGISSNHIFEYCQELIALYREMKDAFPEQADVDSAA